MSADTPYTISIYRDLEQELLHKVFTVWTSNDIPRAEHRDAFNQLKDQGIEIRTYALTCKFLQKGRD